MARRRREQGHREPPQQQARPPRAAPRTRLEPAAPGTPREPAARRARRVSRTLRVPRRPRGHAAHDGSGVARAADQPECRAWNRRARGGTRARMRSFRRRGRMGTSGGAHRGQRRDNGLVKRNRSLSRLPRDNEVSVAVARVDQRFRSRHAEARAAPTPATRRAPGRVDLCDTPNTRRHQRPRHAVHRAAPTSADPQIGPKNLTPRRPPALPRARHTAPAQPR